MAGPLVDVKTQIKSINLDVARELNMGPSKTMEFMVPDSTSITKWNVLLTLTSGFDRKTQKEVTQGDGSSVVFEVADPNGDVSNVIGRSSLHVRVEGIIYMVSDVPPLASNETQFYTLTCKTRTLKTRFDTTKK